MAIANCSDVDWPFSKHTKPKLTAEHQKLIKDMYAAEMKAHDERCVAIEKLAIAVGLTAKDLTAIAKPLVLPLQRADRCQPLTAQQVNNRKRARMGIPAGHGPTNENPPPAYQTQSGFPSEDSVMDGDYLVPDTDEAHAEEH
jgi:hypothetical protein